MLNYRKEEMVLPKTYLKQLLRNWTKTNEILSKLKAERNIDISDRDWRKFVNSYNHNFNEQETYIASGRNGYKLTMKQEEIKKSAYKNLRLGVALIKNAKEQLLELGEKNQLTFLDDANIDLDQTFLKIRL